MVMVVSLVVVFLGIWAVVAFRSLKEMQVRVDQEWDSLVTSLRKRQDILPNLIETVRQYSNQQEALLQQLIDLRAKAARLRKLNEEKVSVELELSKIINRVIDLGRMMRELSMDTNFLELRKEIGDLEKNIEQHSRQYNEIVRKYNSEKEKGGLKLWTKIFGFKKLQIFEVEI